MFDISTIDYKFAIWIIPVIFLFHELEEWNIVRWHKENFKEMADETNLDVRVWLLFISLIGFVWTAIAFLIPDNTISAIWVYLFVDFTLLNGLQHLFFVVRFRKYGPGSFFAVIFGIPADIYITYMILAEGLLPYWSVIILLALVVVDLATELKAVKLNRRPASLRIFNGIAHRLARWMTD